MTKILIKHKWCIKKKSLRMFFYGWLYFFVRKLSHPTRRFMYHFCLTYFWRKRPCMPTFCLVKNPLLTFIRIDFTFNGGDCTTSWVKKVFKGPWVPSVQESWDKFQTVGGPWNLERIKSRSHSVAIKLCRRKLRLVHMVQKSCLDVHTECRGTN